MLHVDGPLSSVVGLDELRPLYAELHAAHLDTASYRRLVHDPVTSWNRRRCLYEEAIEGDDAVYFVARSGAGTAVGYAFAVPSMGADDTFETTGIVELVSLVVAGAHRASGVGRRLLRAVEEHSRGLGASTLKVGVMAGNDRAEGFYATLGFQPGETLLYRPLD